VQWIASPRALAVRARLPMRGALIGQGGHYAELYRIQAAAPR